MLDDPGKVLVNNGLHSKSLSIRTFSFLYCSWNMERFVPRIFCYMPYWNQLAKSIWKIKLLLNRSMHFKSLVPCWSWILIWSLRRKMSRGGMPIHCPRIFIIIRRRFFFSDNSFDKLCFCKKKYIPKYRWNSSHQEQIIRILVEDL